MMVGKLLSFGNGPFLGAMLNFKGVKHPEKPNKNMVFHPAPEFNSFLDNQNFGILHQQMCTNHIHNSKTSGIATAPTLGFALSFVSWSACAFGIRLVMGFLGPTSSQQQQLWHDHMR